MKFMSGAALILSVAIALVACNGDGGIERVRYEVAAYKAPCLYGPNNFYRRGCHLTRHQGETEFERSYSDLRDFEAYQWGTEYVVDVEVTRADPNVADDLGSARVVAIVRSEPVAPGKTFQLALLEPAKTLVQMSPQPDHGQVGITYYRLFQEVDITCELAVCKAYEDAVAIPGNAVLLKFMFENTDPLDLQLIEVTCVAPRDYFYSTCGDEQARMMSE